MQKLFLLPLFGVILLLCSCSAQKNLQAFAFSRAITGGNLQVDEKGKPINQPEVQHLIFIQTKENSKPCYTSFNAGNKNYHIQFIAVKSVPEFLLKSKNYHPEYYTWQAVYTEGIAAHQSTKNNEVVLFNAGDTTAACKEMRISEATLEPLNAE